MWPKDNAESWKQIHEFIEEYPDDEVWSEWKRMALAVVTDLENRKVAPFFRIGMSIHEVILSTLDHHRLKFEPRVMLRFQPREQLIRIAYGYRNSIYGEPVTEERLAPADAIPALLRQLRRLWRETKPATPVPDALDEA